jgi:hypothetical protein
MMKPTLLAMGVAAVAGGAVVARRTLTASRRQAGGDSPGTLAVTVNRPPGEVAGRRDALELLDPYRELIEVEVRPAPGDRGTEVAARRRPADDGANGRPGRRPADGDPRRAVRQALREAKALCEAGEVMRPDAPPTTRATAFGAAVGWAVRRSRGGGVL